MLKKFEPQNKTKNQNAEAHFKKTMFLQNEKRVTAIQNPYCSFIFFLSRLQTRGHLLKHLTKLSD